MTRKQPEYRGEPPRLGEFVDVLDGEHAGLFGAYLSDVNDSQILVRNRDHEKDVDLVVVDRTDTRLSSRRGGR